jgi:uncharacterized membrane protein YdjX (TVP38/TMEM64 family)
MIAVILVIGILGFLARQYGSLNWLVENEIRMRDFVREYPWQSWVFGMVVYTLFSLIPGTVGKSVVCGWLFGFWAALMLVEIGLTLAALSSFAVARYLLRDSIRRRLGNVADKLDRGIAKDGAFYLVMMRVAHVPYSLVNYGAAITSVRPRTFAWTTAAGTLPGTMIFIFVGTRIPTLRSLAENGVWQLLDPLLFALLASAVAFPMMIRWAIRKLKSHGLIKSEAELDELEHYQTLETTGANDAGC